MGKVTADDVAKECAQDIKGKNVLVTGVTSTGLGGAFAITLAKYSPGLIVLATRDVKKADETAQKIAAIAPSTKTRVLQLDLASQEQVRKAAKEVNAYPENINVLVNNAGVMAIHWKKSPDGIETQFAVNHIGHFLFTNLIMGKLLASGPGARVVNVSSDGIRLSPVRFTDWNFDDGKVYDRWRAYGQAKVANCLFSKSLARKLGEKHGLVSVSLHPGVVGTKLSNYDDRDEAFKQLYALDAQLGCSGGALKYASFEQGTATHMFASFHRSLTPTENNGAYLNNCTVQKPEEVWCWARDEVDAEKLWQLSEKLVGEKFEY